MDDNDFRKILSAELAAEKFIKDGASASKINIGVAFYGRGFKIEKD
jgi:GH18 family chitinase